MITAVIKVIWGQHRNIRSAGAIFSVLVNPLSCHPKFHHEWQGFLTFKRHMLKNEKSRNTYEANFHMRSFVQSPQVGPTWRILDIIHSMG
eukprot:1981587-Karenia_brevis.AAC.1